MSGKSRDDLASILTAQCKSCQMTIDFPTSAKVCGLTSNSRWECNLSAFWGQMAIGGGHSHLGVDGGTWHTYNDKKGTKKTIDKINGGGT